MNNLGTTSVTRGLVGEWLLDGNANDTSGSGNNGTETNVTYIKTSKGYQSQAGSFNGSSSYMSAPSTGLSLTTFNHSAWFYTGSTEIQAITAGSNISGCPNINLVGGKITLAEQNIVELISSISNYELNKWVFVSINYTQSGGNGIIQLYINGVLNNTNTIANTFTSYGNLQIGKFSTNGPFNGTIQSVRIYNVALTQDEISTLYREGLRQLGPSNIANYPQLMEGLNGMLEITPGTTEIFNIVTGNKSTYISGTNANDNLGNNRAITNPNYSHTSITFTNSYVWKNGTFTKNDAGITATTLNGTGTYGTVYMFNRTLTIAEETLLQTLTSKEYIYPCKTYDLPNLQEGLLIHLNGSNNGTTTLYDISGNGKNGTVSTTPTYKRQGKQKTVSLTSQSVSWTSTSFTTSTVFEKISGKWTLVVNPAYITSTGITSGTREITDIRIYSRSLSTKEQEQIKYAKIGNFIY